MELLMQGQYLRAGALGEGFYELVFDNVEARVNTLGRAAVHEFGDALTLVGSREDLRGVLISSDREEFIVGADVTEFTRLFRCSDEQLIAMLGEMRGWLNRLEDLRVPTVVAINGRALGGGFELCLACDYRVMAMDAHIGLPEVKLGLCPGWGGTVRLPRLIGLDNALNWICTGQVFTAAEALKQGAVDAVVERSQLRAASIDLLQQCVAGRFDYAGRRREKREPTRLTPVELTMSAGGARALLSRQGAAAQRYPAPGKALDAISQHAVLGREEALEVEADHFAHLVHSSEAHALIGLFLKEQAVKHRAKSVSRAAVAVKRAAVVGAGIMGGGIAGHIALKGTPVTMKDISRQALEAGMAEACQRLESRVRRGRLEPSEMGRALTRIAPTLSDEDFQDADFVIEAVVEHPKVKQQVLADVEAKLPADAILTSNTSTIPISLLAKALQRPQQFCGMHFFNPVHRMPLVEIIRGAQTDEATVARATAFAMRLGKTAIVVNDCPGFFVNRVLFPYLIAFAMLVRDGADIQRVDRLMEQFGWPMGPAYLLDVIGLDTAQHATKVLGGAYPDRMAVEGETVIDRLCALQRLGQKSGAGFYRYEKGVKGLQKQIDPSLTGHLRDLCQAEDRFTDEQIVERMMIPLCIECARTLEESVISSVADADIALVQGIGFPPFHGGVFHYLDRLGPDVFVGLCSAYTALGPLYQPTDEMQAMANSGKRYGA